MVGSGEIPRALILVTKTGKKGKTGSHLCQSGSAPDPSVAGGQPGHLQQSKGWKCPQIPSFFLLEHSGKRCRDVGDFGLSQQSWGMFWSPPRKHPGVFSLDGYPFLPAPPEDAADFGKSSSGCGPAHPFNPEESDHGYQPRRCRESFQKPFLGSQANLWIIPKTGTEL